MNKVRYRDLTYDSFQQIIKASPVINDEFFGRIINPVLTRPYRSFIVLYDPSLWLKFNPYLNASAGDYASDVFNIWYEKLMGLLQDDFNYQKIKEIPYFARLLVFIKDNLDNPKLAWASFYKQINLGYYKKVWDVRMKGGDEIFTTNEEIAYKTKCRMYGFIIRLIHCMVREALGIRGCEQIFKDEYLKTLNFITLIFNVFVTKNKY